MIRLKCVDDHWIKDSPSVKDPEITRGRFYNLLNENVMIIGEEPRYSLIGDQGMEIERPKHLFRRMG